MTMLNKQAFEKACQKFDFMYFNSDGTMPIQAAIEELREQIDGGEECRGRDQQISEVIRILEGA